MDKYTQNNLPQVYDQLGLIANSPHPPIQDFKIDRGGISFTSYLNLGDCYNLVNLHLKATINIEIRECRWHTNLSGESNKGIIFKHQVQIEELA